MYDGCLEYWVVVRETGKHSESVVEEEIRREAEKAPAYPV